MLDFTYTFAVQLVGASIVFHVAVNDIISDSTYFSTMQRASIDADVFSSSFWHHIAFTFNGTTIIGYLNATEVTRVTLKEKRQIGLPCVWREEEKCMGIRGLILGAGECALRSFLEYGTVDAFFDD